MNRAFGSFFLASALSLAFAPAAFGQDKQEQDKQGQQQGQGQQQQGQGQQGQGQQGQGQQGQRQRGRNRAQNGGFGRTNYADQLKTTLGLTDEQVTKVKALEEQVKTDVQKLMSDMQGGDRTGLREKIQATTDKIRGDIRGLLDADQTKKFDEWVKQQEDRRNRGRGGNNQARGPQGRAQRLLDQATKELVLSPEEKSAVLPLVKKVLDVRAENQTAADKRRADLNAFLKGKTASDEDKAAITLKLKECRDAAKAEDEKLKVAQEGLREVLTVDNEAKLCGLGILP